MISTESTVSELESVINSAAECTRRHFEKMPDSALVELLQVASHHPELAVCVLGLQSLANHTAVGLLRELHRRKSVRELEEAQR